VAQLFKGKLHSLTVTILHVCWQYRSCDSSISILKRLQPRGLGFYCRRALIFFSTWKVATSTWTWPVNHHPMPNLTMCTAGLLYFHSPQQVPSRVLNYEQGHVLHDCQLPSTTASKHTIFNCTYKEQDPLTMANWPQVSAVYQHNLATAQKLEVFRTLHYK